MKAKTYIFFKCLSPAGETLWELRIRELSTKRLEKLDKEMGCVIKATPNSFLFHNQNIVNRNL